MCSSDLNHSSSNNSNTSDENKNSLNNSGNAIKDKNDKIIQKYKPTSNDNKVIQIHQDLTSLPLKIDKDFIY